MAPFPLIVFDVNETLLDLETMEPTFERIFGEKSAMRLWFANLIIYSAALTVAGCYVPFTDIGSAVMKMLADTRGIKIDDKDKNELTEKFSTMPPYPEVPAALRKLRNAGFRLFTLTNNLAEVQTHQLEHGGIVDLFERCFSVDNVCRQRCLGSRSSATDCRQRSQRRRRPAHRPTRGRGLYVNALAPDEGEKVADVFYRLEPHPKPQSSHQTAMVAGN
jgi:2-haloalkanoic acid dehalogenase type II